MKKRLALLLLALLLLSPRVFAGEIDLERVIEDGRKEISGRGALRHVKYLAGPECQGRASGLPGCDVAAAYLVERLKEAGVEPAGDDGGYRKPFPIKVAPFPGTRPADDLQPGPSTTSNVVGVIAGSDPELSRQFIVLGGHYDHIGYRDLKKRKVYWGADDNASGTAAVLITAEALAAAPVKPRRSVVFAFFSGEERGLFGSKAYVSDPARPLKDTVLMINLDMVGRNKASEMDLYGIESSPVLAEVVEKYEKASKFRLERKGGSVFSRSDQYTFYERGIPVLFFNSGMHGDYHGLGDEAKKINYGKIARVAELCWDIIWDLGNRDERPEFTKIPPSGAVGHIGIVPMPLNQAELEELRVGKKRGAVLVQEVVAGGPAEQAGVLKDDLVLGLADKFLDEKDALGDLDRIADSLEEGRKYAILVRRDGKPKALPIIAQ